MNLCNNEQFVHRICALIMEAIMRDINLGAVEREESYAWKRSRGKKLYLGKVEKKEINASKRSRRKKL